MGHDWMRGDGVLEVTHWRAPHDFEKVDWHSVFAAMNKHERMAYTRPYRWVYFCVGIAVGFALGMSV